MPASPPRPLKIAHVVRRFAFDEWGGTETVVWNTVLNQLKQGLTPEILTTSALAQAGCERRDGVLIRRFRYWYPYFPLSRAAVSVLDRKGGNPYVPALFRALKQGQYDLVHIHCGGRMAATAAALAHRLGIPAVISLHGGCAAVPESELRQMMAPVRGKLHYGGILDRLRRAPRDAVALADAVICISKEEQTRLLSRHPGHRIVYLPNGVDAASFRNLPDLPVKAEWNIPENRRLVLCISRIDYQKNQLILLEILAHDQLAHVLLIGPVTAAWYHQKIRDRASELGVADRLTVIPGLPPGDDRLRAALGIADVFILPSLHEPFGIAALEAWAAGVPLISAATGGLADFVVDGRNGLLFPPGDPARLLDCYDRLIGNAELRDQLKKQALTDVQAFNWENLTSRLRELYSELIDAGK